MSCKRESIDEATDAEDACRTLPASDWAGCLLLSWFKYWNTSDCVASVSAIDGVAARLLRFTLLPLVDFSLRRRSDFPVRVMVLSLAVVKPEPTETSEGFDCLVRLSARLEELRLGPSRSRLELLSSE